MLLQSVFKCCMQPKSLKSCLSPAVFNLQVTMRFKYDEGDGVRSPSITSMVRGARPLPGLVSVKHGCEQLIPAHSWSWLRMCAHSYSRKHAHSYSRKHAQARMHAHACTQTHTFMPTPESNLRPPSYIMHSPITSAVDVELVPFPFHVPPETH